MYGIMVMIGSNAFQMLIRWSKEDQRSISGHCEFIAGNLISWKSKKSQRFNFLV